MKYRFKGNRYYFVMKGKRTMNESIQLAIISAGLAAFVNCIFQLINKVIDNRKEHYKSIEKKNDEYKTKKEMVYIAALQRLLQISQGFEYTREMLIKDGVLKEKIDKENLEFSTISPQLRLYATDKIYNSYRNLAKFTKFAYASENIPRLSPEGKLAFDMQTTLLARRMQEDLGYRGYDTMPDTIRCPNCACEHDIIAKCPSCGLTFEELCRKLQQILENKLNENKASE